MTTPDEMNLLRYMKIHGVVSWSQLRSQFLMSEGALMIPINSLKRHLYIEQDGLCYRLTSIGQAALVEKPVRTPFAQQREW